MSISVLAITMRRGEGAHRERAEGDCEESDCGAMEKEAGWAVLGDGAGEKREILR
jgi:hypothetical protein